jgi:hypothetical protein
MAGVGAGGDRLLVAEVGDLERGPGDRHRVAPGPAAVGRLGDRDVEVEVEDVVGERCVVHVSGPVAGQPGVAEIDELGPVRQDVTVGEAGTAVGGVRIAAEAAGGGQEEPRVLAVVVADGDSGARNGHRCLALGGLVDLVAVERRIVHPHVRE